MSGAARIRRAGFAALAATLTAGGLVHALSEARLERRYETAPAALADGAGSLERGRHLVRAVGQCGACHGADLSGGVLADDAWRGRLEAPNLTPGRGGISGRPRADLVRAIRHGVGPDGRPLLVMPAQHYHRFGDADLAAIVRYLRSLPPVDRVARPRRVGPLTRLLLATGRAPELLPAELVAAREGPPPAPAAAVTAAYGAYLVETGGCRVCHRQNLEGGRHPLADPDEPTPPDLTRRGPLRGWSERDFVHALRSGEAPDGRHLDARYMPWDSIGRMSDVELRAIWAYLRSLG